MVTIRLINHCFDSSQLFFVHPYCFAIELWFSALATTQAIESDGGDDHRADDHALGPVFPRHRSRAVAQDGHKQRAEDCAEDTAAAAIQARAADDDGGDHV